VSVHVQLRAFASRGELNMCPCGFVMAERPKAFRFDDKTTYATAKTHGGIAVAPTSAHAAGE